MQKVRTRDAERRLQELLVRDNTLNGGILFGLEGYVIEVQARAMEVLKKPCPWTARPEKVSGTYFVSFHIWFRTPFPVCFPPRMNKIATAGIMYFFVPHLTPPRFGSCNETPGSFCETIGEKPRAGRTGKDRNLAVRAMDQEQPAYVFPRVHGPWSGSP